MALEIEDLKSEVTGQNPGTVDIPSGEGSIGISLIDLAAKQIVRKIPVGNRPWGVAVVSRKSSVVSRP